MLVRYRFVNETVEVEVSEEWGKVLTEQDRLEYNNDQKETRRHVSLDMVTQEQGMQFADDLDLERFVEEQLDFSELVRSMDALQPQQLTLLRQLLEGKNAATIARDEGLNKSSVHRRIQRIYAQLKKKL